MVAGLSYANRRRIEIARAPDFVVGVGYMPFQDDMKVVLDYI